MINRINLILRAKNITARQFAEEIGIQPSGMSHIMGGRNNPSLDFVAKVLRRYPEIDANWLILGRGEMYSSGTALTPPAPLDQPQASPVAWAEEEAGEPVQEEVYFAENEQVEETPEVPLAGVAAPAGRRIDKLLFIYTDGTFEECRPAVG